MRDAEILDLHSRLVEIPSVSHEEQAIADFCEAWLRKTGANVQRIGDNVIATAGRGRRLLFNTHLDTVPPATGWTRDPWKASKQDGRVYGLGSNDTKASVAAMMAAFLELDSTDCEVCLMLVPEEETGGKGTEVAWPWLRDQEGWLPEGVVVGEPTNLDFGIEQKGLMILELISSGQACHAANAKQLGAVNPVWALVEDLLKLRHFDFGPEHPELGPASMEPTILSASTASNQVGAEAKAVLDIRTLPGMSHLELREKLMTGLTCDLKVRSTRLEPYSCPSSADIVRACSSARPEGRPFASATMSDQVFFHGVPAVKCGPGVSARSHTVDEHVLESEILEGARFFSRLIRAFGEAA